MEHEVQKEQMEELREHWKKLWKERVDDKVRAEGIAKEDYPRLFVDRGTVIYATRNFKPLNFRNILKMNKLIDNGEIEPPNPYVGGWGKFIRTVVTKQKNRHAVRRRAKPEPDFKKERQHLRKSGKGWLRV